MNILITDIKINELSYFIFLNIGDFGKFLSEKQILDEKLHKLK